MFFGSCWRFRLHSCAWFDKDAISLRVFFECVRDLFFGCTVWFGSVDIVCLASIAALCLNFLQAPKT